MREKLSLIGSGGGYSASMNIVNLNIAANIVMITAPPRIIRRPSGEEGASAFRLLTNI